MNFKTQRTRASTLAGQGQCQAQQTAVFARLQGLFPPTPHLGSTPTTHTPRSMPEKALPPLPPPKPPVAPRKSLKVRIITWNMHDSVPKGDLEELLGKVPLWSPTNSDPSAAIPEFSVEAVHPYHLVVVAGQECPSLSGIPMGLGAGFKLIDKDRDKDKDRDREKEKVKERDREYDKPRTKHKDKDKDEALRMRKNPEEAQHDIPSGWTSMIEDWLCQGSGSALRSGSPTTADVGFPKPLTPRLLTKEPRKGPYQLLTKERLMGIYLSVYIHREIRSLVRGTSRSAVTAGLIGGRVGNKGGVAITINLDGTTFLFLNAHLAAHEGKVNHRLSNLAKIKTELSVDDYLANDDPRVMAEDVTDRFDYTFLCGDLNFRLDISRLHADWLLSRKEYAQALAFDQLTNIMQRGEAFVGFKEATIDFPPTFKYDVLRTLKGAKRQRSGLDRWKRLEERSHRLTEVEERELEELEKEEAEEEGEGEEGASMASSIWTSAHSRAGTDRELDEDEFYTSPSSQTMATSSSKVSVAAHRAKAKWLSLLSSGKIKPSHGKANGGGGRKTRNAHSSVDVTSNGLLTRGSTPEAPRSLDAIDQSRLRPPPMILVNSTKSSLPSEDDDENDDKGVYDSSHKRRVPSWCDRILWKTTVEPDPEPEEEEEVSEPQTRARTRMSQFFVNAFRPLSARVRKDSLASVATSRTSNSFDGAHSPSTSPEPHALDGTAPFSRFVQPCSPLDRLSQVKSNERPKSPTRHHTDPDLGLRRTNSAIFASHDPHPLRRATASAVTPTLTTTQPIPPPASSSRWRFLPSFFSHGSAQSSTSIEPPASADVTPPPALPRKGDVVCLGYHTLDDRGMRRLEGRSDHRPVIGSYAIYI